MNACGLIVEYNPFHNGHLYHLEQSKIATSTSCTIAVMSGNFLQRGEPAIIDKFHRAKTAIQQGVDIVVELPFVYAVQNSDLFARGAVLTLGSLGVSSICFGSEHGEMNEFIEAYKTYNGNSKHFKEVLKQALSTGISFPEASKKAYQSIGLTDGKVDLSQPNNILGFSYVKSIYQLNQSIKPVTIKRFKNNFHDQYIYNPIASATSIRKEILSKGQLTEHAKSTLPTSSQDELIHYYNQTKLWHHWEHYFSLLQYRVLTMSNEELRTIHGMDEGIEHRLRRTASQVTSFESWMSKLKTKRYTRTRLQRLFVHILTNTKKEIIDLLSTMREVPYIRLLGMSEKGQAYLSHRKKQITAPILTGLKKDNNSLLRLDERATDAYYSVINPEQRIKLRSQELKPPFIY